jgi:transcriptional regulator with XRE-family HTH domain
MSTFRQAGPVSGTEAAGAIVRRARRLRGLTQAELGALIGYSAAQISRYERGITPLTDLNTLRRFGETLAIPSPLLGLTAEGSMRHADIRAQPIPGGAHGHNVDHERQWEDGDDPVRRRELIAGTAALTGAAIFGDLKPRRPARAATIEDVLYGQPASYPVPLPRLRKAVIAARNDFRNARYDRLPAELPQLLMAAEATVGQAGRDERGGAYTLLAEAYILAADWTVKLNDDPLAWLTSGCALQAAQIGEDPLTLADARRSVATAMRRAHQPDRACDLLDRACRDIEPRPHASVDELAAYGNLLTVAAYTAAVGGHRHAAMDYITEAAETAARLGTETSSRQPTFGRPGIILYQVSIAQILGDNGVAVEQARTLSPSDIPTPERRGRYWIDVARAFHQWGKPQPCLAALLAAERAAPAEVHYRPPVHRMTQSLLSQPRHPTGLREFARRIGLSDA